MTEDDLGTVLGKRKNALRRRKNINIGMLAVCAKKKHAEKKHSRLQIAAWISADFGRQPPSVKLIYI